MPKAVAKIAVNSPNKAKRGAVQDDVLLKMRRGLMVGALLPGQVVSIRKFAALFGTSPMPVRDAITTLLAANALEELPNRSVRVPILSPARLQELFELRELIEPLVAKMAAKKATPALIKELEAVNRELHASILKKDFHKALELNQRFHFTLYYAAQTEVMMPMIESLWLQCGPTLYFSLLAPDVPWTTSEHTKVIESLKGQKANQVRDAVARDIKSTGMHLLSDDLAKRLHGPASFARMGIDI